MRLKDFYLELKFDVDSLMKLFDNDFIKLQETEMKAHFDFCIENGIDKINCSRCKKMIQCPEDLVRYLGVNLDKDCFKFSYLGEREKLNEVEKRYFDRVYSLIILGKRETLFYSERQKSFPK